jgi:hypothetical protein
VDVLNMKHATRHHAMTCHRQHGLSLIFALLALVALSLGAVALIRSVDTGTLVLGNLGFKQEATVAADRATEDAIGWLQGYSGTNTDSNSTTGGGGRNGYYANSHDIVSGTAVDVTGQQGSSATRELVDWDGDGCAFAATPGSCVLNPYAVDASVTPNVRAQYVIFRLCKANGAITADSDCVKPANAASTSNKRGKLDYSDYARFGGVSGPYYRIVVRSVSGHNAATFTETIVHF